MTETYVRAGKVNWIAKGSDLGVQERTLAPGEVEQYSSPATTISTTYCIEGTVQIEMLGPPERVLLGVGQSYAVPTNRPHQITPHGDIPCRFLLVQGVGKYDRHPVDPKSWKA